MKSRVIAVLLLVTLAGCVRIDIGEKSSSPTLGEEIMDLYKAREAGFIDGAEYESARKKLLEVW